MPWFADIANYKVVGAIQSEFTWHHRRKLIKDANQFVWDDL